MQPQSFDEEDTDEEKIDCYTAEEVVQIKDYLESESLQHEVLATMVLEIGARVGELLALKWTDIDFESKLVDISKSWQYIPGQRVLRKAYKE